MATIEERLAARRAQLGGGQSVEERLAARRAQLQSAQPAPTGGASLPARMSRGSRESMAAFGRGIFDTSQSPSYAAMPENWNPALKATYSKVLDPLGYAASGAMAGWEALAGAGGEAVDALGLGRGEAFARDVAGMPEAFAGTATQVPRAAVARATIPAKSVPPQPAIAAAQAPLAVPMAATPVVKAGPLAVPMAAAPVADDVALKIGATARKAASGSKAAQEELARMARVNPEAKAAADRLGITLPADVFADEGMVQSAAGLARSVAGSEAEASWIANIRAASDKADDAITALGASKDVSKVSDDVFSNLSATRQGLDDSAAELYKAVDAKVKMPTVIGTPNLNKTLTEISQEVGGAEGLSAAESKLLKMATTEGGVTYGRLRREKSLIGKALAGRESPYGSMAERDLKRLYGALAEDQMVAARTAGDDVADMLQQANDLTTKQKDLEAVIVNAFGKDLQGSIARKLETAVTQAGKGDIGSLNRVMEAIPEDLRSEAVLTAIMSATKSKAAASAVPPGGFGFSEYAKFYSSLRQNGKAYSAISEHLSPEAKRTLADLYTVSKRVTDARAKVLSTGKSNQALVQGMAADNLISNIFNSSVSNTIGAGAGALSAGPVGAMAGHGLVTLLKSGNRDAVAVSSALFRDEKFLKMMEEAATTGKVSPPTAQNVAESPTFRKWFATTQEKGADPVQWLLAASVSETGQ